MKQISRKDLWRDWDYSERYPDWREVREYFHYVDKKVDLSRDIRFNTPVSSARFDETERKWHVTNEDGSRGKARLLVICTGFGSKPFIPEIKGLGSFGGQCHHTGLWPQSGLDMTGKRVGVIGTGASGVQVVQEASRVAAHLTVFQRTPNTALPMRQRTLDRAAQQQIKADIAERFARRGKVFAGFDFDFLDKAAFDVSDDERREIYEQLWDGTRVALCHGSALSTMCCSTRRQTDPPTNSGGRRPSLVSTTRRSLKYWRPPSRPTRSG